jgi:hypothetical protein
VDGQIIRDQPLTLFANGRFNHVPLINGNTADEQSGFLAVSQIAEIERRFGVRLPDDSCRLLTRGSMSGLPPPANSYVQLVP